MSDSALSARVRRRAGILVPVLVGVLNGSLSLADTPQPGNRLGLREHGSPVRVKGFMKALEDVLTTCEEGVAGVRDVG